MRHWSWLRGEVMAWAAQDLPPRSPASSISISRAVRIISGGAYLAMHITMRVRQPVLRICFCVIALAVTDRPSLPAAAGSPIRTGLWVTQKLPPDSKTFNEFESQLRANHNLSGVCLHIPWDQVEREPGKPDFSAIDKTVAVFRSVGMKYQLCLKPGAYAPAFVYAEGAQAFETRVTNPHRSEE